jgi:large repetitive protein
MVSWSRGVTTTYTGFDKTGNVTDYSGYQPTVVQGTTAYDARDGLHIASATPKLSYHSQDMTRRQRQGGAATCQPRGKSMVAVIAGNGLGLDNSSLRSLGQGPGGQAVIGQSGVAQYFNAATGNLILQNADEGLIFDGLPLAALRTYNSQGQLAGSQGWLFGFSRSIGSLTGTLGTVGSTVVRAGDDGSSVTYAYDATRSLYVSSDQSGAEDTLSWSVASSTWTWTDSADSQQETYDASGRLVGLSDPQTGAHYSFSYSGSQLSQIVADDGDTLIFGYNAAGQLSSLSVEEVPPGQGTAVTRQQVGYAYDAQGRLSTVTTTLGSDTDTSTDSYVTTYTYDGASDRIASVSQSDGTVVSYTYAADANGVYRVATITTGSGGAAQILTLSYDLGTDTTSVANALGQAWTYTYNAAGQLTQVTAPTVNGSSPTTRYSYDSNGNLLTATDADGGTTSYSYDANGNRLSVEDASGHTVSYTYNADDQVLSQTVYTLPAQGVVGESGYVAPDGAQTTYYVYDASDRLSYVVDPLGNVMEHDYTTTGGLTVLSNTQHYVGVAYSLTGLSPSTPPSLSQLQSWVASAQVQATLAHALRTDYSYDVRGQLTKQTQWDTLGSNGVGTLTGDAGATVTTYTYDAQGRLLQTSAIRGADRTTLETTSYAYDGLDRLVSRTDPLGRITSYVYTDSSNMLAITQANGLTTTQVRNSAGLLISSTSSASGEASRVTTYLYNAAGLAVATIDPAGNVNYTFYDADGRVSGTVDATGAVTAISYDADGHALGSTQYATPVSTSGWISGGALTASLPATLPIPGANVDDRTAHTILDAAGREIATIDAAGAVTTTTYDGEGNAISHTAYATALTPAQLAALGGVPTWAALQADLTPSANDHITRAFYDADQRVVATQDAAGDVITTAYDAAGRVTGTVTHAVAVPGTSSLATLLASLTADAGDQITRTYYDGEGRAVAQVDAGGYLITTVHDETTHITTTVRYATALTSTQLAALTGSESVATLVGLLGGNTANQQSSTTYNADGQIATATAVDGTMTTNSYNLVGQLLSTTVTPATGQGVARTSSATYDAFGDTLTRVDGNHATTIYTYNALGQRITATDALGNLTYAYYDADGRVAYTVQGQPSGGTRNALGNVIAYSYNAFGQVASTRRYASQLTLTGGSSSGTTLNPVTAALAQVAAAAAASPVSASDADGLTTYSYTLDGQLANATDGQGYQTVYGYDAFGDRTQVQQQLSAPGSALSAANSTTRTFAYDARGEQTGETEAAGTAVARSTRQTYDAFGRVTSVTDGDGHVVTYGYDNLGRQVSSSQTVGGVVRAVQTTFDAFNRVVTQTDALGNVTAYQYDVASHRTIVTTPDGVQVTTLTDAYGDTVSVTDGAGDTTTYTYDADGQWLTRTDALGNTSTNQYDADGELIQTTDATGHIVTYSYDASGRVLSRIVDPGTDHLNLTTTYVYDGEGRELSVTDPAGMVTAYRYDADGHVLTQVQDAGAGKLNLTTTYTYDGAGKALTVTVGAGTTDARTTQYVYDSLERLSQQIVDPGTSPHLHLTTTYVYDDNDNLTSVTDANGHTTRHVYNEANARVFTIDAAGTVTQVTYDADGRVTAVRASDTVSYTAYNAEGQVRYRVDPRGNVTETRYDTAGRISETLAYAHAVSVTASEATILQASQSTALSSLGALVSAAGNTEANAQVSLHLYDADGQARFVVQQNTVNGELVGVVSEQRYDAAGRVIASIAYGSTLPLSTGSALSAQLSTSSVAMAVASAPRHLSQSVYDNAGRLRYTLDATNHVIETQVDADGRVLKQLTYANPITVPATLTIATVGAAIAAAGTSGARISATSYDTAGRVHTIGDALGVNTTYTYDATGLVIQQADRSGAVTVTTYDKAGRKTLVQSPSVTVGSYSGTTLQTATQYLYTKYQYDGVGNVTAISQGAGTSAGAWTIQGTTSYTYDASGHQTTTTYPGGTVTTMVTYDALGHAVVDKDANGNHQYKVYNDNGEMAYAIDADGYVTGTVYDAYGRATAITRYATALNTSVISGWAAGQPLSLAQLQQGLVTSASDRTITTTYDQRNQKIQVQQSAIGYVLGMGASAGTAMAAAAPTTIYTYDAYGNQTSSATLLQAASGSTPAIWATTYTYYDVLNRAVMTINPAGQYTSPQGYVTTTTYDAFGEVATSTQYAGAIAMAGVTVNSKPAQPAANLYDRTTSYLHDDIGRRIRETDTGAYSSTGGIAAGSSVTTLVYDDTNRKLTVTVNGMAAVTQYDAAGRVVSVTAPPRQALVSNWQTLLETTPADDLATAALYVTVSPVTTTLYDALGHALSTTVSAGGLTHQTRFTYDALGRQATATDADGHITTFHYDNNGHLTSQVETLTANGAASTVTTTCTYDADGQQLSTSVQRSGQSGYDSYTKVKYNPFGEITDKGDNFGYEAHYTYDNAGNLTSAPDATTGAIHTYAYDLAGHQVFDRSPLTGGSGTATIHNTPSLDGQVTQQARPGNGASAAPITFGYDRWGNVITMTDAAGNVTQNLYDSQNHLIREIEAEVLVVSDTGVRAWTTPTKTWYYNVNGQLLGVTDENGHTSLNTYDGAGRLTIAQDATTAKTTTAYDALGRAVAQQMPSVNTAGGLQARITYTAYNDLDQVIEQGDFLLDAAGTARTRQAQQIYALNIHGDRIQVTDALLHTAYYDYDSQHRVVKSQTPLQYANGWSETFTYDANGNKTGETTANGDHQSWVYDYFGRMQSHVDLSGATTAYTYDASSGLLTSITSNWVPTNQTAPAYLASGWNGSASTQNYSYYANGQIAQLTDYVDGVAQAWDTYQYDANGNTVNDTHWGSDGTGQQQHLATITTYDSHNRISVVTTKDTSTGTIESREAINYDAAGNRRAVFAQSAYGPTASPISGTGGAPTAAAPAAQTATAGQAWALSVASRFTDNVGFGLTFTAAQADGSALPSWMHFNSNGNFSGTPSTNGSWSITVTGTDVNGQSVSATFTVTVPVAVPVFTSGITDELGSVGTPASFTVPGATDANGSALTYSARLSSGAALPSWLSFNAGTRTFTGTPPVGSIGSYALQVIATAANGGSASETLAFTVISTAPVLNGTLANQTVSATRPFAFSFSPSVFNEADGDTLSFTAGQYQMVPQGDGLPPLEEDSPLPSWMTFYGGNLAFTGTPPASAVGQTFKLYVEATNPQGQVAEGHFTVTVQAYVQPAPVYHGNLPGRTGTIGGSSLNLTLPSGAFTEPDGGALTYSAMVLVPEHELDYPVNGGTDVATRTVAAQWVALSQVGLSINATTGAITGVPTTLDYVTSTYGAGSTAHDSAYQIEITATNAQSGTATGAFTLTNDFAPPAVQQALSDLSANPGAGAITVVPVGAFSDPYGHGLTYTATLSSGATLSGGLGWSDASLIVGTVASGSYTITVTAKDGLNRTVSASFTLTVSNAGPVFTAAPTNHTVAAGVAMAAYQAPTATDANGDTITYSASGLPAGLSFNASTRIFSGTPTATGTFTVTYTATDIHGAATHATFTVTVTNTAPVFSAAPSNLSVMDSVAMAAYQIPVATDANGDVITYSASGLPPGLSFNASTRTFSGTPTSMGTYTVTCTATDSRGAATNVSFIISVTAYIQPAPVYHNNLPSRTGIIGGGALNLTLPSGVFTESDGGALNYTAMVLIPEHELDYPVGGGTDIGTRTIAAQWVALSQVGLSINATTGAITGSPTTLNYQISQVGSGSYAHDSAYQIEITATNAQSGTATGTFTLTNSFASPASVTALANHSVSPGSGAIVEVPTGAFTDPYAHGLNYSATLSSGAALPSGLTWSGTGFIVGAVSSGSYTIKVIATDGLGHTGSATFTLTVANAAPVINGALSNRTAVQGSAMAAYVAPAASDANGDAITYSASGLPAGIGFNASTRTFSGTPTTAGTYTVTYTATDSKGLATSATFAITVSPPANLPPVYNGGIPAEVDLDVSMGSPDSYTVPATAFSSPAGQALTYSVLQSSGAALPTWLTFNASTRTFTAPVRKPDASLTLTLTAKDTQNRTVSHTFNMYVWGTGSVSTLAVSAGSTTPAHGQAHGQATTQATVQDTAQVQTETAGTTPNIQSYWFSYDADNRVVVNNGALSNGQIVVAASTYTTPSYANQYDAAGNVAVRSTLADGSDQFLTYGGVWYSHAAGTALTQRLVYDARSELVETDYAVAAGEVNRGAQSRETYDADGHLLSNNTYERNGQVWAVYGTAEFPNGYEYLDLSGWLWTGQVSAYDADGQVTQQAQFGRWGVDWKAVANKDDAGTLPDEINATPTVNSDGVLVAGAVTTYTGFDHADNVTDYSYYQPTVVQGTTAFGATYHVNYLKKDGYLEQSTTGTPTVSGYVPATDTSCYDAFGRRLAISQTSQANSGAAQNTTRVFADDASGEIVQRRSGTVSGSTFTPYGGSTSHHYTYVNGQQVSDMDEGGDINVASTLTAFSSGGGSASSYVVQGGDTLESIAQAVYGNSQYSYIVAEANGLSGDGDLVPGQSITIPSVTTNSNTANTFKPYDPNSITGSTTPSLPATPPPPPSQAGCNTLAMIVIIAVVVVASIFTAGVAAEAMAGEIGSFTSIMSAGSAAMVGASTVGASLGASMAAAAVGGFAGSVAGQLTGDALGVSHGFSFGQALTAGFAAGLTAGIGGEIGAAGSKTSLLADSSGSLRPAGAAVFGAGAYASGIGAAKVTGEATHFSWAGLAASAMASGVTAEANLPSGALQKAGLTSGTFAGDVAGGLLSGGINRETAQLLGDHHVGSWASIGEDAFGNALGNAAIAGIKTYQANQLPAIDAPIDPIDVTPSSLNVADMPQSIAPVGPAQLSTYTVQSGDTLSGIAGTSDPATLGMLMQLNGLTSSTIQPGMQLQLGDLSSHSSDQLAQFGQSGQAVLNEDNAALAARSSQGNIDDVPLFQPSGGSVASSEQVYTAAPSPYANWSLAMAGPGVVGSGTSGKTFNSLEPYKLGVGDYFGAGLAGASSGMEQFLKWTDTQGMPTAAATEAETSVLGVKYGARTLVGDSFGAVGGIIAVGETYSAYSSGDYRQATQSGGAALGAIAGAEIGTAIGASIIGLEPITIPLGAAVGAVVGAIYGGNAATTIYDNGYEGNINLIMQPVNDAKGAVDTLQYLLINAQSGGHAW